MAGIAQTVIRAPETTLNIPSSRRVRIVDDRIAYLDPDAAPLTVILMRGASESVDGWNFEWMEKELSARWDAINNGAGYNNAATDLVVNNAKFFSVGDVVNVPRTSEKMIVTASSDSFVAHITVSRGVGSTAAAALVDKDDLQIIGNAYSEGALSKSPKSVAETYQFNYTQIVRTPLGETRTQQNTKAYGGPGRPRLRLENGVYHKIDLERTALFGERNLDQSDPNNPLRYTGGILYFLTTAALGATAQVKDFNGTATEPEVEDWMQSVFQPTGAGDTRTLFASPLWISVFDQIAQGRMQVVDKTETYGVTVRQYISAHGQFNIVKHRLLENNPAPTATAPSGYAGYGLALDMTRLGYRYLASSQTQLREDIQAPDYDGWKDEWLTEMGWVIKLAKVHGVGKNVTS